MPIEAATTINQLDATKPGINDLKSEGDDQIRLVKATLKATLPNITGVVTATHVELNHVAGVTSPIQAQITAITAARIAGDDAANAARLAGDVDLEARKADTNGETYTGTHNFIGAAVSVAAPTIAAHPVTKLYADALAFSAVLPGQTGNAGRFVTTDGTTASWANVIIEPVLYYNIGIN